MNNKILWGVIALVLIAAGGMYGYSKMSQNKAEQEVNSYLNQAQPESLAEQNLNQQQPALNTQDTNTQTTTTSTTATAAAFTGSVPLTPQNTKLAWIGRKTLVVGYEDAGKIDITSGSAELKDGKVVSATAKIDMNSINVIKSGKGSDEDRLTGHLKSPDFFDAEKYPTAELQITQAKLISEAAGVQNYEFSGTLNMKGVTVAVSFPGKVTLMGNSIKLESETKLDRTKWGVNYGSSKLADSFIDDFFTLKISVNAVVK
jgi:polyisoprenoid-binding protein YceI